MKKFKVILLTIIALLAAAMMWKTVLLATFVGGVLFFAFGPYLTHDVKDEL